MLSCCVVTLSFCGDKKMLVRFIYIYIYMASGEFHTDKSRIVLNNNGAVITILVYSISCHIDFNTVLFRGPTSTPSNSTHHNNKLVYSSVKFYIHCSIAGVYIHQ